LNVTRGRFSCHIFVPITAGLGYISLHRSNYRILHMFIYVNALLYYMQNPFRRFCSEQERLAIFYEDYT